MTSLRWRPLLLLAALVALTVAAYRPAFDAGFVAFDDTAYVPLNPPVAAGLRLESVRWALSGVQVGNWHPITWLSHMADVELFGLEPAGPHAVNVALHVLNVVLLFFVLRALTGDVVPSLFVAGVLALHPANVESVAWIAQRKTLLSTAFVLLALGSYGRYARTGGGRAYAASLAALAASLACKPMFVTFPFLLLLLDAWPLRRPLRAWLLLEKVPFLALAVAASVVTLFAQQEAMSPIESYPLPVRLANAAFAYVRYLGTFVAPVHLAAFYPLFAEDMTRLHVAGNVALLAALTAGAFAAFRRAPWIAVGWLWFLGTLVPVIGIVQVGMQSMADRYVYVPFIGLAVAVAWSGRALVQRFPAPALRAGLAAAVVTLFCVWAWLAHRQAATWHDGVTLFEHALAHTEKNWLAHGYLASVYLGREEYDAAIVHSEAAVPYGRSLAAVRTTYGLALYHKGEPERAFEQFELATIQDPGDPVGFMNLGWMLRERGEYDRAIASLVTAASRVKSDTPPYVRKMIHANWAGALEKLGRWSDARAQYDTALDVDSAYAQVLRDAAQLDLRLRDPVRAMARLDRALALDPDDVEAIYLRAAALQLAGDPGAASALDTALARDPRRVVIAVALARTLAAGGPTEDGVSLLEAVLARPPVASAEDARFVASTVHAHLGEIALERGDAITGRAELHHALTIWPEQYDANHRLAWILATSEPPVRDPARAVALAEKVVATKREYGTLATLAVAYAATGRTAEAAEITREALALAAAAHDARAVALLEQRLAGYEGSAVGAPQSP